MNDVIFFLPYDVDGETICALKKEAKSRGLQISAKFSKKVDIVIVVTEKLHLKWEVLSYLKREFGLRGYWGGKCVHMTWYTDSFSNNGGAHWVSLYPYLLCYMHPSLGFCPPRVNLLKEKIEQRTSYVTGDKEHKVSFIQT